MARHTRAARDPRLPLPKRGKVIFQGRPYHIASARQLPEGGHEYTLYPDGGPDQRTLFNITADRIMDELRKFARYEVGQSVSLGYSDRMEIFKRQWDFRNGTAWYYVANPRRNVGAGWISQGTMMKYDRELDPVLDNAAVPTPQQRSYPHRGR